MKIYLIFMLLITLSAGVRAETYFVHSPQMSLEEFNHQLDLNNGHDLKSGLISHKVIQNLNQLNISTKPAELRHSLLILDHSPLRKTEVDSALYIFEKIGVTNLTADEKLRYFSLLSIWNTETEPQTLWIPTNRLAELIPYLSTSESSILVDGMTLNSLEQKISDGPHQWLYLSNSHYPILQEGELSDFLSALKNIQPFNDSCGEMITPWKDIPDFKLKNMGSKGECTDLMNLKNMGVNPTNVLLKTSIEHERQQAWMVPTAVIAGALTIAYFRNKEVVFHLPTLKF